MRVIGIDPGYDRLGLAVVERTDGNETVLHSECIETDRSAPIADRLTQIGARLEVVFQKFAPTSVGIETLFFNKNLSTAIAVAQARGVVLYLARKYEISVREFGPQEVKVAVTGYGKSDKSAVFSMLMKLVRNMPKGALDDEYDAIAIAVTCLAHHQ